MGRDGYNMGAVGGELVLWLGHGRLGLVLWLCHSQFSVGTVSVLWQ